MSQVFDKYGRVVPVTKIKVMPNIVVQIKTTDSDGYKSVQIGTGVKKKANKPSMGRIKKIGVEQAPKVLREVEADGEVTLGSKIYPEQFFRKGLLVDVTGVSKGKGFAGVVKRWGFAGGPRTHGQSDRERAPGSIGASTIPGRVYKGLKMAGHLGNARITVKGLEVIDLNKEAEEVLVKGSVPGGRGTYLLFKKSKLKKKPYHEPEIPERPVEARVKEEIQDQVEANLNQTSSDEKLTASEKENKFRSNNKQAE